jgi:hypothetical protein
MRKLRVMKRVPGSVYNSVTQREAGLEPMIPALPDRTSSPHFHVDKWFVD